MAPQSPVQSLSEATSLAYRNLQAALVWVERAWVDACAAGPTPASTLLAAAATQWIVSDFSDLTALGPWAQRLASGPPVDAGAGSDAVLVYRGGVLAAHLFGAAPGLPDAEACVVAFRAHLAPLSAARDLNLVLAAAEHAASWMTNHSQTAAFDALVAALAPWLDAQPLDPLVRARWLFWLGTNQMYADQRGAAELTWQRARQGPEAAAWPWLAFHTRRVTLRPLLEDGKYEQARHGVQQLREQLDFARPLDVADDHHLHGWLALAAGEARPARQHYELACEAARRAGLPVAHMAIYHSGLALSLVMEGQEDAAEALISSQPVPPTELGQSVQRATLALIRACRGRRLGEEGFQGHLVEGLGLARQHGLLRFFRLAPGLAAQLCADALAADIEAPFVRRVIAARGLVPPPLAGPAWPWPVLVRSLGGFELQVGGTAADTSRRKPMDLLRAIVARGPLPCDADSLAEAVWPDAEGDMARTSLDTTLHRLRKVLGRSDCLLLQDGRVGLNRPLVWVDAWALAEQVEATEKALQAGRGAPALRRLGDALIDLYGGDFLGGVGLPPWALAAHARWRSQFERAALMLVTQLQALGDRPSAEWLCRRALERQPLAEPLVRAFMGLLGSQGRPGEALAVFGRYRDLLNQLQGGPVSPGLQALAVQVADQARG